MSYLRNQFTLVVHYRTLFGLATSFDGHQTVVHLGAYNGWQRAKKLTSPSSSSTQWRWHQMLPFHIITETPKNCWLGALLKRTTAAATAACTRERLRAWPWYAALLVEGTTPGTFVVLWCRCYVGLRLQTHPQGGSIQFLGADQTVVRGLTCSVFDHCFAQTTANPAA